LSNCLMPAYRSGSLTLKGVAASNDKEKPGARPGFSFECTPV
jgi:hypothetical protein